MNPDWILSISIHFKNTIHVKTVKNTLTKYWYTRVKISRYLTDMYWYPNCSYTKSIPNGTTKVNMHENN